MELLRIVKQWLNESDERKKKRDETDRKREEKKLAKVADGIIALSLTCRRCDGLAIPVLGTDSHYNCVKCDCRFSSAKHRLGQTVNKQRYTNGSSTSKYVYRYDFYDSAVDYIKMMHKN